MITDLLTPKPLWKFSRNFVMALVVMAFLGQIIIAYEALQEGVNYGGMPIQISALLAPVYEEILFRAIILGYLAVRIGNGKAILLSSLLFGLWHFKNVIFLDYTFALWYQMGYSLGLGLILGWVTIKTDQVWPAVILHYLNNIGALLFLLI